MRYRPRADRGRALLGALLAISLSAPLSAESEDAPVWLTVHSQHFEILTDATAERGAEIALNLELFRGVFAHLAPGLELRSPAPIKIIAFRDARSYAPYKVRPDSGGNLVLGYFLRHPDGNFLTLDAGTELVGAFAVIYHEFVHYLVDHNFPKVPRWFNEGLAEYYSTLAVEGDRVYLGRPVERHVRWLRYDNREREARFMSHDFSLRQVLTGEASRHSQKVGGFYAFSWALVHYLLTGGPERLDQTADFLARLREDEDPEDAFERAFDAQLEDLEETLRDYAFEADFPVAVLDVADFVPAAPAVVAPLRPQEILFHLGDLLARMRRLEIAEKHFQTALELDSTYPEAHAGIALVRDLEGRFTEAGIVHRDAIALASKDPLTYLRYGRHLIARLRPDEGLDLRAAGVLATAGKMAAAGALASSGELSAETDPEVSKSLADARAAFRKAISLDEDFAEAKVLFGVAHLFGDVKAGPGIAALREARRSLPDRDDVSFYLLLLLLKDGEFEDAERHYAAVFRDHADLELVQQAEEEIARARLLHRASTALGNDEVEEALRLFDEAIAVTTDQDLRDRMAARLEKLQDHYSL